ncbi:MAG: hypothetical protein AAF152_20540 [Cyanobacteria bacterium P01_A01_bin.114]
MPLQAFAIPLLTLLLGIVSLLFDLKENSKHKALMLGLIVLSFAGIFGLEVVSNIETEKAEREAQEEITALTESTQQSSSSIQTLTENNKRLLELLESVKTTTDSVDEDLEALLIHLKSLGYSSDSVEQLAQSLEAEAALQDEILESGEVELFSTGQSKVDERQQRGIAVEYFTKDVDQGIVGAQLSELGFKTEAKDPIIPDRPTNAIWFGADVSREDVQLVALTLVRAGVQIDSIRPFAQGQGRTELIQVGSDTQLGETCEAWTVESIQQASRFSRANGGCAATSSEVAQQL